MVVPIRILIEKCGDWYFAEASDDDGPLVGATSRGTDKAKVIASVKRKTRTTVTDPEFSLADLTGDDDENLIDQSNQ